jgi:hypothetical protein
MRDDLIATRNSVSVSARTDGNDWTVSPINRARRPIPGASMYGRLPPYAITSFSEQSWPKQKRSGSSTFAITRDARRG